MNRSKEVIVKGSMLNVRLLGFLVLMTLSSLSVVSCSAEKTSSGPEVPAKGMVTMLDIGAMECVPCKMMAPIMKELEEEYQGKAAIIFIDVWKRRDQGPKFGIRAIPTQIFYDKDGKEVFRHEGFLDKKTAVAILERLGVKR
jgi:thioredoxin 1